MCLVLRIGILLMFSLLISYSQVRIMDDGPIREADGDPVVAPYMKVLIH